MLPWKKIVLFLISLIIFSSLIYIIRVGSVIYAIDKVFNRAERIGLKEIPNQINKWAEKAEARRLERERQKNAEKLRLETEKKEVEAKKYQEENDPHVNPHLWDYMESKSMKCWFHKKSHKKVCEPK